MIEHVGLEFMEEFFGCCESVSAEDGVLVLQVQPEMPWSLSLFYGFNSNTFLTIKAG